MQGQIQGRESFGWTPKLEIEGGECCMPQPADKRMYMYTILVLILTFM